MRYFNLITILFLLFSARFNAQCVSGVVNDYTPVLGFGCDSSILKVGSTMGFFPGDAVLIIQMKGAASDQSNSPNFGNVLDLGSAGLFEFNRIRAVKPGEIYLEYALLNPYDITGAVQVVRVPAYENLTACNLTCRPWDGTVGGVLVVDVKNTLTLTASVDVSGRGFRGGTASDANESIYHETQFFYPPDNRRAGAKGEGITTLPTNKSFGRGKAINGGGGGNAHNAGGGGGGNGGNGGNGGLEYYLSDTGAPTPGTNGIGGQAVLGTNQQRITLGGGGGSGQMNDNVGESGGNGGGIVILKTGTLIGNGQRIMANGASVIAPGNNRNDGQGGGGAGGSVLVQADQIEGTVFFDLRGGNGGNCLFFHQNQIIGPGGGGGGGRLLLSPNLPPVLADLAGGKAGVANQNNSNLATNGLAGSVSYNLSLPFASVPNAYSDYVFELKTIQPECPQSNTGEIQILNLPPNAQASVNGGPFFADTLLAGLDTGKQVITIKFENGCLRDTSIVLQASHNASFFIPNAFSPNGDGQNEVFTVFDVQQCTGNIAVLRLFNRWGEMIFEGYEIPPNNLNAAWDGRHNGHPAPPDIYVYYLELRMRNGAILKKHGDVTLIR
jgi:gliding motility-associated-like protein